MSEVQENALHRRGVRGLEESERLEDFEMREILFRGKRADNGEIIESNSFQQLYGGSKVYLWYQGEWVEVVAKSRGEYTGLTDKNGKKIFEGDIVQILGESKQYKNVDYNALIIFKLGGFCAIDGTEDNYGLRRYCLSTCDYSLKVIGNIHDNPELLK